MYTIVFQTFVFMQLFNEINSRKLGEKDFNIFANLCNSRIFWLVWLGTFATQLAIVEFGGRYLRVCPLSWR